MILSVRYPHVRDLIAYYAQRNSEQRVLSILEHGLDSEQDADCLGRFVWKMIDQMAQDRANNQPVLGAVDNTAMLPDLSYEMDILMEDAGYAELWERISDEA